MQLCGEIVAALKQKKAEKPTLTNCCEIFAWSTVDSEATKTANFQYINVLNVLKFCFRWIFHKNFVQMQIKYFVEPTW